MRFEGQFETVICEDCSREISHLDDEGFEDNPLCSGCRERRVIEHQKSKCSICNKKMGDGDYHYNTEDSDSSAHSRCVETLPGEEQDIWSDNFEY